MEGGYQACNPGQGWSTHFDGRGFLTQPDAGGWTWGLELERYGFRGRERELTSLSRVSVEGGRVDYQWVSTDLKYAVEYGSLFTTQSFSDHAPLTMDFDLEI